MEKRRAGRYERVYDQLTALVAGKSPSLNAAMSTICAVLHAKMPHHSWTGFYVPVSDDELHVITYQGPVACQILKGQGACLHAFRERMAVVVSDVASFPGHIACDPRTKSEIVIPVFQGNRVAAVLDVDSYEPDQFTDEDVAPLERIVSLLDPFLPAAQDR